MFTLLIVEDQPLIRAGLKKYFNWGELGVQAIFEAENGEIGIKAALQHQPDIIITDISMPRVNGLEMIERLQDDLPDTQYVILTGFDKFDYAQRAIRTGVVQDFLLKPLQYNEGLATIQSCIERLQQIKLEAGQQTGLLNTNDVVQNILKQAPPNMLTEKEIHLFEQIGTYILQHMDDGLTLHTIAEHFYYNSSYLSRLFKTKLGRNYTTFVTEVKVHYAKALLMDADYSVSEVSRLCGYKSYKYFVKVFKSVCQKTPTAYRRSIRL